MFICAEVCCSHTLSQLVPLTLSRMWNLVHSVSVKSVTHNVSPPPPPFPAERGPVYCALGSSTGCCYTWLPSCTMVSEIRPSASEALVHSSDADRRLAQWIATCAVRALRCGCVCMCGVCVMCVCVFSVLCVYALCVWYLCSLQVLYIYGVWHACCVFCVWCVYMVVWCVWYVCCVCYECGVCVCVVYAWYGVYGWRYWPAPLHWPIHMVLGVLGGVLHRSEAVKGQCYLTDSISSLL